MLHEGAMLGKLRDKAGVKSEPEPELEPELEPVPVPAKRSYFGRIFGKKKNRASSAAKIFSDSTLESSAGKLPAAAPPDFGAEVVEGLLAQKQQQPESPALAKGGLFAKPKAKQQQIESDAPTVNQRLIRLPPLRRRNQTPLKAKQAEAVAKIVAAKEAEVEKIT